MLLVAALVDPFGVESAAANSSLVTFQRLYAPFYPADAQQNVVVVAIENADLPLSEEPDSDWPPLFDDYAKMIEVIGGEGDIKPAGIFFDFLLDRKPTARDPIETLCNAIAAAKSRELSVVFAAHPDDGRPEAFNSCAVQPEIASATWRAAEGAYSLSYEAGGETFLTAAAHLYRKNNIDSAAAFDAAVMRGEEMTILWGANPPVYDPACVPAVDDGAQWLQSIKLFFRGLTLDPEARSAFMRQQKCLYHPQFSARQVVGATAPAQRRIAGRYFDGKYVLVGAALSDGLDYHPSPVHGAAPGVYLHAMALDNLLTFDADFVRRPPDLQIPFTSAKLGVSELLQAATLLVLACVMALFARKVEAKARLSRVVAGGLARLGTGVMLLAIVAATVSVTFFLFHWTPINWGGVLIAGLLMIAPWNFVRDSEDPLQE